ncbi:MAG TPA: hypothetical protein VGO47_12945 [Chlamydiales bacterium]|jgi:hypothetical protein|nr:hypothetical protein [Chlamydiales bacterium]
MKRLTISVPPGEETTIGGLDIYMKSLQQFETVVEKIMDACERARLKLDELEGVANGFYDIAIDELDLEITDRKRIRQQYRTIFGGNKELVDKLTNNVNQLQSAISFVVVGKQALLDAAYTLNGMKASISAIREKITTALDSDDILETEIQYAAIAFGLTRLIDVHDRGNDHEGSERDRRVGVFLA